MQLQGLFYISGIANYTTNENNLCQINLHKRINCGGLRSPCLYCIIYNFVLFTMYVYTCIQY